MKIIDVEVCSQQLHGSGGFVQLRRMKVRNIRDDGSKSPVYTLDAVERPCGIDAVAVLPYHRPAQGSPLVLLRRGLRPCPRLGRAGQPTRDGQRPALMFLEVVAGVIEQEDKGEEGLRRRATLELAEEAGLEVVPDQVEALGPPLYLSFGAMAERAYFCKVATDLEDLGDLGEPEGDGSLLEEGGEGIVLSLTEALDRCAAGEIQDIKTEVALRRLADELVQS